MRYIVTSDIHFGHKNTPTRHIIESFTHSILNEANRSITALFIAGDLFDHLLYLNTTEAQQIMQFFHRLLNYCCDNDIALKVLEGTPSHDWYQSSMLAKINDVRSHKAQLTYMKALDIEYCDRLQKHILYIPDEWCNNQEDLDVQIRTRMLELGLVQVDMAILHGAFRYQAKGVPVGSFLYDEAYFLGLVRGLIHIGHYHVHTHLDRIVAQGSLERLAHGEEDPKGYVLANSEDHSWVFVQNPRAYTYKTIHVTAGMDLNKLDKAVRKHPAQSHIRLAMKSDHPFNLAYKDLSLRYLDYHLKKLIKDTSANSSVTYILSEDALQLPDHSVLETNVYDAVMRGIDTKYQLSPQELVKLHHYAQVLKSAELEPEENL